MKWPALPSLVHGAGGPIRVRLVKQPKGSDGALAWGTWEQARRVIEIQRSAPPEHRRRVFYHEMGHALLDDAGLCHLLTSEGQEAFADAYASARMAEFRGTLG